MIKLSVNKTNWTSLLARGYNHSLDLDLNLNTRSLFDFGPEKLPRLSSNGPQIEQQEITAYKNLKRKENTTTNPPYLEFFLLHHPRLRCLRLSACLYTSLFFPRYKQSVGIRLAFLIDKLAKKSLKYIKC